MWRMTDDLAQVWATVQEAEAEFARGPVHEIAAPALPPEQPGEPDTLQRARQLNQENGDVVYDLAVKVAHARVRFLRALAASPEKPPWMTAEETVSQFQAWDPVPLDDALAISLTWQRRNPTWTRPIPTVEEVRILDVEAFQTELVPLLRRVFRSLRAEEVAASGEWARSGEYIVIDANREPFPPALAHRTILNLSLWTLDDQQCRSLVAAVRASGDAGLYFYVPGPELRRSVPLEDVGEEIHDHAAWVPTPARYYPLTTPSAVDGFIEQYQSLIRRPQVHALVSPGARWAVVVSNYDHAVFAGSEEALRELCRSIGHSQEELLHLFLTSYEVQAWLRHERFDWDTTYVWIPTLLAHVLGEERAASCLQELLR